MDYSLSNMYVLQQSDDLEQIFAIPSYDISFQEQNIIREDLSVRNDLTTATTTTTTSTTTTTTTVRKKRTGDLPLINNGDQGKESEPDQGKNENTKAKLRREIERQRRQEMAKLYASLRSLLPLEFIKGKRSISDHMHQAVSYIKFMQESIEELSIKRDQLKKVSNENIPLFQGNNLTGSLINRNHVPNTVIVSSCQGGLIEILINVGTNVEQKNQLSRVLVALLEEGLSAVSCISTKINDRLLHTIQSEASNQTCISDLSMLQEKLTSVVNT